MFHQSINNNPFIPTAVEKKHKTLKNQANNSQHNRRQQHDHNSQNLPFLPTLKKSKSNP
jgi:hypothetical protein